MTLREIYFGGTFDPPPDDTEIVWKEWIKLIGVTPESYPLETFQLWIELKYSKEHCFFEGWKIGREIIVIKKDDTK